jgi:hypothetical protein
MHGPTREVLKICSGHASVRCRPAHVGKRRDPGGRGRRISLAPLPTRLALPSPPPTVRFPLGFTPSLIRFRVLTNLHQAFRPQRVLSLIKELLLLIRRKITDFQLTQRPHHGLNHHDSAHAFCDHLTRASRDHLDAAVAGSS